MAAEKTDVNVSELLQQLEELRQKKARNVKKLKRKLGRAVVLKQLDSKSVPVKCDSNGSEINKSGTSEVRNVLVELNCKNASLCSIQSPKNEQSCREEARNCTDNNATTCPSMQSCEFKQTPITKIDPSPYCTEMPFLENEVLINKDTHLSNRELKIFETLESPNKTVRDAKYPEQQQCRKRSVSELHKEDLITNCSSVKKKTKLSNEEIINASVTWIGDDKVDYQKLSPKIFEINPVHSNLMLKHSDDQLHDEREEFFENDSVCLISSSQACVNEERKSMSFKLSTQTLPQLVKKDVVQRKASLHEEKQSLVNVSDNSNTHKNYTILNDLDSHSHFNSVDNGSVQTVDSSALSKDQPRNFDEVKDSCVLTGASLIPEEKLVVQPVIEAKESVCISSSVAVKHDFTEVFSNNGTEEDLDTNVTEVEDTEVRFMVNPELEAVSAEDKLMGFSQSEAASSEDVLIVKMPLEKPNSEEEKSPADTDGICLMDIQSDVASFEEVSTEKSEPEVIDSPLVAQDKRDSVECLFTDEEDNDTRYINSEEIDAMFKSGSEEDNFEDEDTINSQLLEVADTSDSLKLEMKGGENRNAFGVKQKLSPFRRSCCDNENTGTLQVNEQQCCIVEEAVVDSNVLVVPETELFDFASYNETEADDVAHNVCIGTADGKSEGQIMNCNKLSDKPSFLNLDDRGSLDKSGVSRDMKMSPDLSVGDKITVESGEEPKPNMDPSINALVCNQLYSETDFDTDSLGTEDFLKLVNYQRIPLESDNLKSNAPCEDEASGIQVSGLKFQCCLQSEISEAVIELKMTSFNNSQYLFIQHLTWIQVWRQENDNEWTKIFAHQVETLQLQELCLSQNKNYLVLVMLLSSEEKNHCLQFLVFERESRLIKLMEHAHWFENRCEDEERVFLCGLDDLKFASAQGQHTFKVYAHSFSCLDGDPRLLTVTLGSTSDCLHSLCRIDKLPNALLGMSNHMLYVWHLLEARLVTSVRLQVEDTFVIESCIWTTVENGLVFLMATCQENEEPKACQLLAANLATGFCEVALSYSLQPAQEARVPSERKMNLVYSEPFIGATCKNGAFIWSVEEEYCCASLNDTNYTSIAIIPTFKETFLVVVGCDGGCVNCYELKGG